MSDSVFRRELAERSSDASERRWVYVPYDQLSDRIGPLSEADPGELGIVLVESPWKASRRPYHQQKLALVLANQRQFALEQAERGVAVEHHVVDGPFGKGLRAIAEEKGGLLCMHPAERELRADIAPLVKKGLIEAVPHGGWLTTPQEFTQSQKKTPWRMDSFYRAVRKRTGYLMDEAGKPLGGKLSHDADNREAWHGEPKAAVPPSFAADAVTQEVADLVADHFGHHPGQVKLAELPTTAADARALWKWALRDCLPFFGPYEDAMSVASTTLFHSRVSPLVNLHRLLPADLIADVLAREDFELRSREGFLRQLLGWREFVHHVHEATDGFRQLPEGYAEVEALSKPGDGGYRAWAGKAWKNKKTAAVDGGAAPSFLEAHESLPPAFWGKPSGLNCLDVLVDSVWEEGWSHHITRLMVLSNLGTLLDVEPRELTDWFWAAYIDAYDWVVEPNVLAMGTFGVGDLMTTKPYISGAAYIAKMSDYCGSCSFDPKKNCPITSLYWAFLDRHREALADNARLRMPLASLRKRAETKLERDRATYRILREALEEGRPVQPSNFPS